MLTLIRRILTYRFFPVCWTLLLVILLCIPGSRCQALSLFGWKHLDKFVHIFLFGMNVLFWGWHYGAVSRESNELRKIFLFTTMATIALGIALEFVQLYFIPNRSFDGYDIIADAIGL